MDGILQIGILLAFLFGGAILVRIKLAPKPGVVDRLIRYVLWALLFSMGFRIGNNPELFASLGSIGLLALASSSLAVIGSCLAVAFASLFVPGLRRAKGDPRDGEAAGDPAKPVRETTASAAAVSPGRKALLRLKAPILLLLIVIAGGVAGVILPPLPFDLGAITNWTLNALLFFIGMQFAQSGLSLKNTLVNPQAIAVPLATIIGTLASSLLLVPLFGLAPGKSLALSGGFGWYSLSGVLITNLGDPVLGSASFLANMLRESMALVLIPFLGRSAIPSLAVSVGGATSMDVTLPLIEQSAGPWIVPMSFMSGAILSLVVPFLVPLCYGL